MIKTWVTEFMVPAFLKKFKVDLWDLGEFNQKGTIRTKWGTSDELTALSKVATGQGMYLYFDAVLNHKASADEQSKCQGIQVDWNGISRMARWHNFRSQ
jgi:alpha-amylase